MFPVIIDLHILEFKKKQKQKNSFHSDVVLECYCLMSICDNLTRISLAFQIYRWGTEQYMNT